MKKASFMLQWQDDDQPNLGEGISRTSSSSAALWSVDVVIGGKTMKTTIRALNKTQAIKFTNNRYPNNTKVIVHGKATIR